MTLGALSLTGNQAKRGGAGVPLNHSQRMPYDGDLGEGLDSLDFLRASLENSSSGFDLPAAIILETVQVEGGVRVASTEFLRSLQELSRRFEIEANTETTMWYKNHVEAVYCVEGEGEVQVVQGERYPIGPGALYVLDGHERHILRARHGCA